MFQSTMEEILNLPLLTEEQSEKRIRMLYSLSNHVEKHYHPVSIAKKQGGNRNLLIPDALLKQVQRQILHNLLKIQPISSYARAYYPGATIKLNAAMHQNKPVILRLDIKQFFSSILFPDVLSSCFSSNQFSTPVGMLLANLCCYRGYLPQGAPTSPTISNLVMKPFDTWIGDWCAAQQVTYTRYCDDLFFSGNFDVVSVKQRAESYLEHMGFVLNQKKTCVRNQHNQQIVTGVVVNEKLQTTRNYRRVLRQELYYCRKYGVASHIAHVTGKMEILPEESRRYLQSLLGKVQFVLSIQPEDLQFQKAREELKRWLSFEK